MNCLGLKKVSCSVSPLAVGLKSKGSVSQLMDDLDLINSVDRAGRGDG